MPSAPSEDAELERRIHWALQRQPPRRAPASLQRNVLAAIERRGARHWWRNDFAHWPLAARAAFVVFCAVPIKLAVEVCVWLVARVDSAPLIADLAAHAAWIKLLVSVSAYVAHNVPGNWLYAGAAIFAGVYAAVFGIGAAAYRTLYASR